MFMKVHSVSTKVHTREAVLRARPGRRDRSSQRAGPMKRLLQKRLVEIAAAIVVWKDVGKRRSDNVRQCNFPS